MGRTSGVRLDGLGAARAIVPLANQVWLGGDGGLYVSEDFGETWAPVSLTSGIREILLSRWPIADPTVFVGTGGGLLRSRDGGRTLRADRARGRGRPPPRVAGAGARGRLRPGPARDRRTRARASWGRARGCPTDRSGRWPCRRSSPWTRCSSSPPRRAGSTAPPTAGRRGRRRGLSGEVVGDLVWLGPFLYAAGDNGFYRSQDAGDSWTRLAASPGRPSRLMFPAGAGRGARGLPGHGPGPLPDDGRRRALGPGGVRRPGSADGGHLPAPGTVGGQEVEAMRFTKAHGLGNDFILVAEDAAPAELSPWAVRLCDRHRGDRRRRRRPARAHAGRGVVPARERRRPRGRDLGQRPALPGRARGAERLGARSATWSARSWGRKAVEVQPGRAAASTASSPTSGRPGSAAATCRWPSSRRHRR